MKKQLLKTVKDLRKEGINLQETPPLFKWSYDEEPNIEFQLLIIEYDPQLELDFNQKGPNPSLN